MLMDEPRHGYDLFQEFTKELGGVWRIGQSQMYAQLNQLEEAGLVSAELQPQASRPARKVFHLTPGGRQAFLEWMHQPTPYLRHIRIEVLARLYFFRKLSIDGLESFLERQREVCDVQVARFARLMDSSEDEYARLVLDFRRGQLEAVAHWLDRCTSLLGTAKQPL
jgi:DNA-binding PadR family transcriptional regulator